MSTRVRRGILASVAALALSAPAIVGLHSPVAAEPASGRTGVDAPVPDIDWSRCTDLPRTFCATVRVPRDYDEPEGPTIRLDIAKTPALDGADRLGTMFVNPGGPGGSARDFAPWAADLLGDTVALRYDVIGIDPRGVGRSTRMKCRTETKPPKAPSRFFPETKRQSTKMFGVAMWYRDACRDGGNKVVDNMTTADTARDMDLIRQAIGEDQLNYYGVSYGTYLGATYAAMFPDLVGRMVLDSVLEPKAWTTGRTTPPTLPNSTRHPDGPSAHKGLRAALAECDRVGRKKCELAPGAQRKWNKLTKRAKAGKLRVDRERVPYSDLIGFTLGSLYSAEGYDFLAIMLQEVYRQNFDRSAPQSAGSARAGITADDLRERTEEILQAPRMPAGAHGSINVADVYLGVTCADTDNPVGRAAWWNAILARPAGGFGSFWTWTSAPCSKWRTAARADRFVGPWNVETANPVLLTGNIHDPATAIWAARKLATRFAGSRLVELQGWGHGALWSSCIRRAYDAYYLDGTLPAEGATCKPDIPLFGNAGGVGLQGSGWAHSDRFNEATERFEQAG